MKQYIIDKQTQNKVWYYFMITNNLNNIQVDW
jgi:hypothetical protein